VDQEQRLSQLLVEFYEKLSSWEHAVVRGGNAPRAEQGGRHLTLPQMHGVEILGAHGPMRMKELAERTGVTTGTLTVGIDRLEGLGLVRRRPNEQDRRSVLVELTPEGESLYREHERMHLRLTGELTAELDEQEVALLVGCLEKMLRAF
jgi:DNA-binding MarR family transcriptional regulator